MKNELQKELNELRNFVMTQQKGGMKYFQQERHHILQLSYACMRVTDKTFSDCQRWAWQQYRKLRQEM